MDIIKPYKGLNTDSPLDIQPDGTYRYALNATIEDETIGDLRAAKGNVEIATLPTGLYPVGKCYFNQLNNTECVILFIKTDNDTGEIGVFSNDKYSLLVSNVLLGDIVRTTYRLRRGCEHTFYYVDSTYGVRKLVIDDNLNVKTSDKLFKDFKEPNITTSVNNSGGLIVTGSYAFALQYLDSDLNSSQFSIITDFSNIYLKDTNATYNQIYGTISNLPTSKSIELQLSNLDTSYSYYRIAIIKCTSGTGVVTEILLSNPIGFTSSTSNFTYSGQIDGYTFGSTAELVIDPVNIHNAKFIEQIDNRLILMNTTEKIYDYCSFQQSANKIKAYVVSRLVDKSVNTKGNSKNTIYNNHFLGGEVYALGIVYRFSNGQKTPVYHINNSRVNPPNQVIQNWSADLAHIYTELEYNALASKLKYFQVYDTSITTSNKTTFNYYETSVAYPEFKDCQNLRIFPDGNITHHRFPETTMSENQNLKVMQYGIQFENIEYPHPDIIGHEFVYAKRTEENKTIIDKGILGNLAESNKFIGFTWLTPRNRSNYHYYISPEFLYNKKLPQGDYIQVEGVYKMQQRHTTVNGDDFGRGYDGVGGGLSDIDYLIEIQQLVYRDFISSRNRYKIKEQRLLDYYSNQSFNNKTLLNLSLTNRAILVDTDPINIPSQTSQDVLYVSYRVLRDVYTNLFDMEYIKCHDGMYNLTSDQICYNGDVCTNELNYENTFFRDSINGIWKGILGIYLVIVAAALTVVSLGTLAPAIAAAAAVLITVSTIVGASITVIAQTVALIIDETSKGTYRELLDDKYNWRSMDDLFNSRGSAYVAYTSEIFHNLFVESTINIDLRISGTETCNSFFTENTRFINYAADKILYFDDTAEKPGYVAKPVLCHEYYKANLDFSKLNDILVHRALPITFYSDCCDTCYSKHKNRSYYSLQSFTEERVDNYELFLPNNYKDLPSEYGEITSMFKYNNGLYYNTSRNLYVLPQQFQERITNEIVSFLGTGEYFGIPPRQLLNDEKASGGTTHEIIKTPYGVVFIDSEYDSTIWLFDGKLNNITDGNVRWFINNLPLSSDFENNPYNPQQVGINIGYDDVYDVLYITRKSYELRPEFKKELVGFFLADIGGFTIKDNKYGIKRSASEIEYVDIHDSKYFINRSWTKSYNFKTKTWISFHSFVPDFYFMTKSNHYSLYNNSKIYKHGIGYRIYGEVKPFIGEFVFNKDVIYNKILDHLYFITDTKNNKQNFFDEFIVYNQYQTTGLLKIKFDKQVQLDFFGQHTRQVGNEVTVTANENILFINALRNYVKNYQQDLFTSDWVTEFISKYPIDKVVNSNILSYSDWTKVDVLRDRYFVVRMIYNNKGEEMLALKYIGNDTTLSIK